MEGQSKNTMESAAKIIKRYNKEKNTAILSKIQALLKDNDVSNGEITVNSYFEHQEACTFTKDKHIYCNLTLPGQKKAQVDQLRKKIAEDPELKQRVRIWCFAEAGCQFVPIEGVHRLEIEGEKNLTISHIKDTVLLMNFSLDFIGEELMPECKEQNARIQEMLEKNNDKWKGKVHVVGAFCEAGEGPDNRPKSP